jgi:MFS family permease
MLFVVLLPFSSYVAALSLIQGEWEINNTQAGAIFSAYLAGYAFSALFIIPLTDRVEPRYVLIGSVIVSVVAQSLFPLAAHGTASGVVLRAVAGVGLVGVYMPGLRLIAERFADRGRGMAMGVYVTAFYAANSASLVATGLLMSSYEWRDAYLILAIASAASIPIVYLLLRKHVHPPSSQSSGRLDFSVLKSRPVRYFMLGYGLHGLELYAVRVWLPAFLVATLISRGVDAAQAAVTAATVGGIALAVGAAGPLMGGIMSDRWGRAATASAIFALSGLCSWTFGWTGGLPWGSS